MEKILVVEEKYIGSRLDVFLSRSLPDISRSKIHAIIKDGRAKVNGKVAKPAFFLKAFDKIQLSLPEIPKQSLQPYPFEVNIIYEDDDVIVVNKPSGITVHPPHAGCANTLVNALIYMKKELAPVSPLRPGVVHRLDNETSGVMVLAKNSRSYLNLVEQFRQRAVRKEYRAIVWGVMAKEHQVVDMPLARDSRNRLQMKVSFLNSKNACTEINVADRLSDATVLSLKIHTGRMHQIRVHLKFLGYPIAGDRKYGKKDHCGQMLLHAYKLGFNHPSGNDFREFVAPLPERFVKFIEDRRCK